MADKYLYNNAGTITEREGTVTSAGAGNAGDIVALDAGGKLDSSVLPTGVGAETKLINASEALAAGDWVNIYSATGTAKCRKADATSVGKEANGFVLAAVNQNADATVYVAGINNVLSGLTDGDVYYLSTSAGIGSTTAPSSSGNVVQRLGRAISDTEIAFQPSAPIVLA